MTGGDSTSRTRRRFLKDAGAAVGGAAIGGLGASAATSQLNFQQINQALENPETDDLLGVRVKAATPSDPNYEQPRGPGNRGIFTSSLSPVGINSVENYFDGETMEREPVTSSNGLVAAPGSDKYYVVDTETGETNIIPANGVPSPGVFHEGDLVFGDINELKKANPLTGDVKDTINRRAEGAKAKYNDKLYMASSASSGVAEVNLDDFSINDLEGPDTPPSFDGLAVTDNGEYLIFNEGSLLNKYDIQNETAVKTKDESVGLISLFEDGEVVGISSDLKYYDENLNQIDSVDTDGDSFTPPIPFTDDEGTKFVYNVDAARDGKFTAYKVDSGKLKKEWEEDLEGTLGQTGMFGNTLLISGSKGLIGVKRENGNELFSRSFSKGGRVGMPYTEKIPLSSNDGFRIVDPQTDTLGSSEPDISHEWRNMPENLRLGEEGNWTHYLEETTGNGDATGLALEYILQSEDGTPYTVTVDPFSVSAGTSETVPWSYTAISSDDGSFQGSYNESTGEVVIDQHPLDIDPGETKDVTFKATPEDSTTTSSKQLL
jgi:hypothetical protein